MPLDERLLDSSSGTLCRGYGFEPLWFNPQALSG